MCRPFLQHIGILLLLGLLLCAPCLPCQALPRLPVCGRGMCLQDAVLHCGVNPAGIVTRCQGICIASTLQQRARPASRPP